MSRVQVPVRMTPELRRDIELHRGDVPLNTFLLRCIEARLGGGDPLAALGMTEELRAAIVARLQPDESPSSWILRACAAALPGDGSVTTTPPVVAVPGGGTAAEVRASRGAVPPPNLAAVEKAAPALRRVPDEDLAPARRPRAVPSEAWGTGR